MNAVFRCDATASIGFGHLSRCIALAEALQLQGVSSTFAGQYDTGAKNQIAQAQFEVTEVGQPVNTDEAAREMRAITAAQVADFIIVDSYRADDKYLAELRSLGHTTVLIDDFCALNSYPCDVVLNFTWAATTLDYPSGPTLLLGPRYLPARRQLVGHRPRSLDRDRSGAIHNLLIAIGGADPKGITARVVRVLQKEHAGLRVHAIAATSDELAGAMSGFAPGSSIIARQPDLSEQFVWADAVITGGGLIKYESAYMGVPAAAIAQNEGQDGETQALAGAGLVFDLGLADTIGDDELASALEQFIADADGRANMADRMRETFSPDPTADAANAILEAIRR